MKFSIGFLFSMALAGSLHAKVILPKVLSSGMVLQQNSRVKLWGQSTPNQNICIQVSWNDSLLNCKSKSNGDWEIFVNTPPASFTKHKITIKEGNTLELKDILIGDVWFTSGQSNMEMPFRGYSKEFILDAQSHINAAQEESNIRIFTAFKDASVEPTEVPKGRWLVCNPKNLPAVSAISYFFALKLSNELKIPIGIISSSYGGSSIEGWLDKKTVDNYSDYPSSQVFADSSAFLRPCVMYRRMLLPYKNIKIKGFLWYQGESNIGRHATYGAKLKDLVTLWRKEFNDPTLPFYAVEIAPFFYGNEIQPAKLREATFRAIESIAFSGFVCTNDLVPMNESHSIHPSNKKPVGDRLANLALNQTYKLNLIEDQSPSLYKIEGNGSSLTLSFKNTYQGLMPQDELIGFEAADSSLVFKPIFPKLNSDLHSITFQLEGKAPLSVRYCFKNYQIGNVKNSAGLPLIPFRTDDWDN